MAFTLRVTIGGLWIAVVDKTAVHLIAPNPPHHHDGHNGHHDPHYARVVGKKAGLRNRVPFDGGQLDLSKLAVDRGKSPRLPLDCLSLRDVASRPRLMFPREELLSTRTEKVGAHVKLSGGHFEAITRHC